MINPIYQEKYKSTYHCNNSNGRIQMPSEETCPKFSCEEKHYRNELEKYIFNKIQEYLKKRLSSVLHLTSISNIRRHLKHDCKPFIEQANSKLVNKTQVHQWIDEYIDLIENQLSYLHSFNGFQDQIEELFKSDKFFSSPDIDNEFKRLQLQRAKTVLHDNVFEKDEDLLAAFQKHIVNKLTPRKLEDCEVTCTNENQINFDNEYENVERIGHEYLAKLLDDFKKQERPNLELNKKMINLGIEHMIKRPNEEDLQKVMASRNLLMKAEFILRCRLSYKTSLRNIADDFMFLRFGCSTDKNENNQEISEHFILLIHKFLNTLSYLVYLLKANSTVSIPRFSSFSPFTPDLPNEHILSPSIYIDEWTWILEKWKNALETFPISLTNNGAFDRLVRTTIGVGVSRLYGFALNNERTDLEQKFFQACQTGYYYGIAYALVDGLQDNEHNAKEKVDIDKWLENVESILCGRPFDRSALPKLPVTPLLTEAFDSLVYLTSLNGMKEKVFTDLALLLRSQRVDKKDLENSTYNDIDLFIGPLLKAHFTYTATVYMAGATSIANRDRLWIMPFLGQLTDDCRDFREDRQTKSITPVTYYTRHYRSIFNPFWMFLLVSEKLFQESNYDKSTGAFLGRRILRTLRTLGNDVTEFLEIFSGKSYPELYTYCDSLQKYFPRVSDPEKSMFRHLNRFSRAYSINHRKLETFAFDTLPLIEQNLLIETVDQNNNSNALVNAMNYSLKAGGKRLRPLLLLIVAQLYDIEIKRILPLAHAIEYLHTSSLIFDDLPAQDNAPLRRNQPTIHTSLETDGNDIPSTLTEARAQLAGVNLISHAVSLVTTGLLKEKFSYECINHVTAELSISMNELCKGQFLDLQLARTQKILTIEELDQIAYLKTGKAFEIVFVCPTILVGNDSSLNDIRQLAKLFGILFQMKDDLLDVQGQTNETGKLSKIDQQNKTITYVSLLGTNETEKRLYNMRKQAETILNRIWSHAGTMRNVLEYICERNK